MTVAELRAALAEMPAEAEVVTQGGTCDVDEAHLSADRSICLLD